MKYIPDKSTQEQELLTFEYAKQLSFSHSSFNDGALFGIPDSKEEVEYCRYFLGQKGNKTLVVIGVNPSTAVPILEKLDPTLNFVNRIKTNNGYDSFVMFNLYPQRATSPKEIDKIFNKELHDENLKAYRWFLDQVKTADIWAAWGTSIKQRRYLETCLSDIYEILSDYKVRWLKAGKDSKDGHPHHPLYLKQNTKLEDFNIQEYLVNTLK